MKFKNILLKFHDNIDLYFLKLISSYTMNLNSFYAWKKAPFVRLLSPLVAGILIQWYIKLSIAFWMMALLLSSLIFLLFFLLSIKKKYTWNIISGVGVILILFSLGGLLTWFQDVRNNIQWLGAHYDSSKIVKVVLQEPLVEKPRSYKAVASIMNILDTNATISVSGNIIIYFKKDSTIRDKLGYGSQLLFIKKLSPIKNRDPAGTFDYERYCLFQGITNQVYLTPRDFVALSEKDQNWFTRFIFQLQDNVLNILRTHIAGEKEKGLAEALLIGYKNDVDKTLLQSYANTGVIHVIAISGLHLGLIYWLLVQLMKLWRLKKELVFVKPIIIIICLWIFSILAGAQPSILRAAVMFTFLVVGNSFRKNMSIINSLAASAFLLLCYNPFWLWDVGFQLSYAALLSIVVFMKPIYNLMYVKNKLLDHLWQLVAVSIAAQLLTTPFSLYYFQQFPNYFLLTNVVAVPLSSLILLAEIALCAVSFSSWLAAYMGKLCHWLIRLMNDYVEYVEKLPFSIWKGIDISIPQVILLFMLVVWVWYWLAMQSKSRRFDI